ncbi:MAG: Hpt domain-containing protein [Chloroflexaceae bacterium]|nr:Hpt domain-containing protein [Chloroflexaceae bacterium]
MLTDEPGHLQSQADPSVPIVMIDWQVILGYLDAFEPEYRAEEIEHLISLFTHYTPDLLENLHEAVVAADAVLVRRYAHNLVANSGTVGAKPMAQAARELERHAINGTLETAPEQVVRLRQMFAEVAAALPAWRTALHLAP